MSSLASSDEFKPTLGSIEETETSDRTEEANNITAKLINPWPKNEELWDHASLSDLEARINHRQPVFRGQSDFPNQNLILNLSLPSESEINASHAVTTNKNGDWRFKFTNSSDFGTSFFCKSCEFTLSIKKPRSSLISDIFNPIAETNLNFILDEIDPDTYSSLKLSVASIPLNLDDQLEGLVNPTIEQSSPDSLGQSSDSSKNLSFLIESSEESAIHGIIDGSPIDDIGYKITASIKRVGDKGKPRQFSTFTSSPNENPAEWRMDVGDIFKEEGRYTVSLKSMDAARNRSKDLNTVIVKVISERPVTPDAPQVIGFKDNSDFIFYENPPEKITLTGRAQFKKGAKIEILNHNQDVIGKARIKPDGTWKHHLRNINPGKHALQARWRQQDVTSQVSNAIHLVVTSDSPVPQYELTQIGDAFHGKEIGDGFGTSVSLSGNGKILAIGTPFQSQDDQIRGRVDIYKHLDKIDKWVRFGQPIHGSIGRDGFGSTVSLSKDGKLIAIGSPGTLTCDDQASTSENKGSVSLFKFQHKRGSRGWVPFLSDELNKAIDSISSKNECLQIGKSIRFNQDDSAIQFGSNFDLDEINFNESQVIHTFEISENSPTSSSEEITRSSIAEELFEESYDPEDELFTFNESSKKIVLSSEIKGEETVKVYQANTARIQIAEQDDTGVIGDNKTTNTKPNFTLKLQDLPPGYKVFLRNSENNEIIAEGIAEETFEPTLEKSIVHEILLKSSRNLGDDSYTGKLFIADENGNEYQSHSSNTSYSFIIDTTFLQSKKNPAGDYAAFLPSLEPIQYYINEISTTPCATIGLDFFSDKFNTVKIFLSEYQKTTNQEVLLFDLNGEFVTRKSFDGRNKNHLEICVPSKYTHASDLIVFHNNTENPSPTFTGEYGEKVTIEVINSATKESIAEVVSSEDGAWSYTFDQELPRDEYLFSIQATDMAGNRRLPDSEIAINIRKELVEKPFNVEGNSLVEDTHAILGQLPALPATKIPEKIAQKGELAKQEFLELQTTQYLGKPLLEQSLQKIKRMIIGSNDRILGSYEKKQALNQFTRGSYLSRVYSAYLQNPEEHSPELNALILASNIFSSVSDLHKITEAWYNTRLAEANKKIVYQFLPLDSYLKSSKLNLEVAGLTGGELPAKNVSFKNPLNSNVTGVVDDQLLPKRELVTRYNKISSLSADAQKIFNSEGTGFEITATGRSAIDEFKDKFFDGQGVSENIKIEINERLENEKSIRSLSLNTLKDLEFDLINLKDSIGFLRKELGNPNRDKEQDELMQAVLKRGIERQTKTQFQYEIASARAEVSKDLINKLGEVKSQIDSFDQKNWENSVDQANATRAKARLFSSYTSALMNIGTPLSLAADIWSVSQNEEPQIVDNLMLSSSAFEMLGLIIQKFKSQRLKNKTKRNLNRAIAGTEVVSGALIAGAMTVENVRLANCLEQQNHCGSTPEAISGQIAANSAQTTLALLESASTVALDHFAKSSTKATKASKMAVKVLGKAAPVFGVVASVAGAIDPIQWEEFNRKSRVIEGYDPTIDSSTELYVDSLTQALDREKGFYAAREAVDVATGVASSLLMASGVGAPLGLLVVAGGFAINAVLTAIEHGEIDREAEELLSNLNESGGGGTNDEGVTNHFNNRLQEQRNKFLDKNLDLIQSFLRDGEEPYTDVTVGYSVALTETDLRTAARARAGNLLEKSYENFIDSVSSQNHLCGEFGPEHFVSDEIQVNLDEAIIRLPKPRQSTVNKNSIDCDTSDSNQAKDTENIKNKRLLKFLSPLRPQGVEVRKRTEAGKNKFITSLEFKDLKKGWHIIDSTKSNTTFSLDDNWVTQFKAKKGGNVQNISMKISAGDGDDQFYGGFSNTQALMGGGNDSVTYSSQKLNQFLDKNVDFGYPLTILGFPGSNKILVGKQFRAGIPTLKQDFRKLIEREGDKVEEIDYTVVLTEKSNKATSSFDTISDVEILSLSQANDHVMLFNSNSIKRLILNDGDDRVIATGLAIEDIQAGNGDDVVQLTEKFPANVDMGNGHDHLIIIELLANSILDNKVDDDSNFSSKNAAKHIFKGGFGIDILEVPDAMIKNSIDDHKQQIATNQFVLQMAQALNDNGTAIAQNLNGYLKHPSRYHTLATDFEWYKYKLPKSDNILSTKEMSESDKILYGAYSTPALNGFSSGNVELDQHYHVEDYRKLTSYLFGDNSANMIFSAEDKEEEAVIWGSENDDILIGSEHPDAIFGGAGDDVLVVNTISNNQKGNNDVLIGGTGFDIYVQRNFESDPQHVVIHPGEGLHTLNGDVLRLSSDLDDLSFLHKGDDLIIVNELHGSFTSTTLKDFYKDEGYTMILASFTPYEPSKNFDVPFDYRILTNGRSMVESLRDVNTFVQEVKILDRDFAHGNNRNSNSFNIDYGAYEDGDAPLPRMEDKQKLDRVVVPLFNEKNVLPESTALDNVKELKTIDGRTMSSKGAQFKAIYNQEVSNNTHLDALKKADALSDDAFESVKHFRFFYNEPEVTFCKDGTRLSKNKPPSIGLGNNDYFFGRQWLKEEEGQGLITIPSVQKENHVYDFYSFGKHKYLTPSDSRDLNGDTIVIFGTPLENLTYLLNGNDLIIADTKPTYDFKTSEKGKATLYNISFRSTLTIKNFLNFMDQVNLNIASIDNITNPNFKASSDLREKFASENRNLFSVSLEKPIKSTSNLNSLSQLIKDSTHLTEKEASKLLTSTQDNKGPILIADSLTLEQAFTLGGKVDKIVNKNGNNAIVNKRANASDSALYSSDLPNIDNDSFITGGRPIPLNMSTYDALTARNPKIKFKNGTPIVAQIDNNFMMGLIRKDNPPTCLEINGQTMQAFWASYNEASKVYNTVIDDIHAGDGLQYLSQSSIIY